MRKTLPTGPPLPCPFANRFERSLTLGVLKSASYRHRKAVTLDPKLLDLTTLESPSDSGGALKPDVLLHSCVNISGCSLCWLGQITHDRPENCNYRRRA